MSPTFPQNKVFRINTINNKSRVLDFISLSKYDHLFSIKQSIKNTIFYRKDEFGLMCHFWQKKK